MSVRRPFSLALVVVAAATLTVVAGARVAAADASTPTHIRFDPVLGALSGTLPHGTAFVLEIVPGLEEDGALVRYAAADDNKKPCSAQLTGDVKGPFLGVLGPAPSGGSDQVISTSIPKLGYNYAYCFSVTMVKQWSAQRRQAFLTDFTVRLKEVVETHPSVTEADVRKAVSAALGNLATAEVTQPAHAKLADVITAPSTPISPTRSMAVYGTASNGSPGTTRRPG
jgi:hypothetical protein